MDEMVKHINAEELADLNLDDLDVEELERRLEFVDWSASGSVDSTGTATVTVEASW